MILTKFLTHRVSAEFTGDFFAKVAFLQFLAANLHFCVKCKNAFISETLQDRVIMTKFLIHTISAESTGDFRKNAFPPFLAAILNFCFKRRTAVISETMRDRAISTKFLTHRVSAESTGDFHKNHFGHQFCRPS